MPDVDVIGHETERSLKLSIRVCGELLSPVSSTEGVRGTTFITRKPIAFGLQHNDGLVRQGSTVTCHNSAANVDFHSSTAR